MFCIKVKTRMIRDIAAVMARRDSKLLYSHFLAVSSLRDSAGGRFLDVFRTHHVQEVCPLLKRPLAPRRRRSWRTFFDAAY